MDFIGLIIGFLVFFTAISLAFTLLVKHDLHRPNVLGLVLLSATGHFLGGLLFYTFAVKNGGDSRFYFYYATTKYLGLGYHFVLYTFGYLRWLFLGDSFLGAFLLSAAIGFLGSVFYLLAYKSLLDKISFGQKYFLLDKKILVLPALFLLCWPSYFFWSAGIGKDSFCFLAIGMLLFVAANQRISLSNAIFLLLAALLGFFVRPYLFLIIGFSTFIYLLFMSRLKLHFKLILVLLLLILASKLLLIVAKVTNLTAYSFQEISQRAVNNQTMTTNFGRTNIPLPTRNPVIVFLFLPYLMVANLFLPLSMFTKNILVVLSSIENCLFVFLVIKFLNNRNFFYHLKNRLAITKFFLIYFLTGTAFLSMINTNLGLAMREKMMYVPAFLIIIFLVEAHKRILVIDRRLSAQITDDSVNAKDNKA